MTALEMDYSPLPFVVGVYSGFVTLGILRGRIRLCTQCLLNLLKLCSVALVANFICWLPVAVVLTAIVAFCLYHSHPSTHLPAEGRAVFITGCDRGIGQQLAIQLDGLGMNVFAGCLFPGGEGEATLKSKCSERLRTVPIDVSNPEKVHEAAEIVKKELGDKELWGVVNNAGICYIGNLELLTESDVRKIIDVNLVGQIYVIRAFLPLLRASRGRLVNIASNVGLAPASFHAVYAASKAGVAMLTATLRMELKCWGINVSTIIPSGYRTGIVSYDKQPTGDRWWAAASEEVKESYGRDAFYPENKTKDYENILNPDFSGIANKMIDALLEKSPKAIYYKGLLARSLPYLYWYLPTCIADHVLPAISCWYKFDPPALRKDHKKKGE